MKIEKKLELAIWILNNTLEKYLTLNELENFTFFMNKNLNINRKFFIYYNILDNKNMLNKAKSFIP